MMSLGIYYANSSVSSCLTSETPFVNDIPLKYTKVIEVTHVAKRKIHVFHRDSKFVSLTLCFGARVREIAAILS